MASRVLLISTNRCDFPYPVFPLGLAMVDTALQRAGHVTSWHDCQTATEPVEAALERFRPDYVCLSLRNIDDVVFKRQQTYYGALVELCRAVRRKVACPVIIGGSGFSIFPEALFELTGADYGIVGEGEESLNQLLGALERGADPSATPGLVHRRDGRLVINGRAALSFRTNSEATVRPRELVEYYLRTSSMLNVQTQRGCAFECCYCTYPLLEGVRQRRREPEAVAEDFADLERAGARYAFVVDSVFNSSPTHVVETCEAIIRRNLKLRWCCFLRPQGLTREQMAVMARAGLTHIEFGTDSFCDPVLAAYGKHFVFGDILAASELAREAQVDYCHFLICGGPGETVATLRESHRNSQRLRNAVILALPGMRVYPGTRLFDAARRREGCPQGADLLEPHFYFSPDVTFEEVAAELQSFSRESTNWIVNEPGAEYAALAVRLRQRGVVGPMWSYLALMQRVLPRLA